MRTASRATGAWVLALTLLAPAVHAQESPFLSGRTHQLLNGEISGDAAFETIRFFTQFHRLGNSPGFTAAADHLQRRAEAFGLEDVAACVGIENAEDLIEDFEQALA